ncbi:MAG TPA: hypothetical protein VKS21_03810 [Spirochaetota bacterium]|nr:hypothetical protein [Spirochaetota bacterium]
MYFSLKKLINYNGNRFELAKACMDYAHKVRYLQSDEYKEVGEKDALVALKAILDNDIKYTRDETEIEDDFEDMEDKPSSEAVASPDIE